MHLLLLIVPVAGHSIRANFEMKDLRDILRRPGTVQVGRAGRFGTKGLAITFVASEQDSAVLNQVHINHTLHATHRERVGAEA